jgi:ABC-type glycerol-3-phosphate transport system substrate-binding protein
VEWHAQEAVVDLNPYVSDPLYGLGGSQIADFPSVFWEQDQFGELRLGMPAQRTARILLYNQTWAKELGYENPPASAQESSGFRFLTPQNIEAARFVKGLSEDGCAWKTQNIDPLTRFVDRSALFATAGLDDLPDLARAFAGAGSTDQWTVLPFPGLEGSVLVVYGSSYILFESEDAEQLAAWTFVRWLLSPDNQGDWVNSAGMFPLQASTMGLLADYAAGHPQWEQAVNLLPQGRTTPELAAWRTVRVALGDGFSFMFRVDTPVGQVPSILAQLDAIVTDLNQ